MSAPAYFDQLLQPLSADNTCGDSIEDTQLLAGFDAYRLFGRTTSLDDVDDWREIKSKSLEALAVCKDFRLLGCLATAALRVDGLLAFCAVPRVAAQWLENYWTAVHPRLDDDAILRKNALSCLADRMAVIDALRRQPIVKNAQLGSYSLRDVEIAKGQFTPPETESRTVSEAEITAAFMATPVEQLVSEREQIQQATASLKSIDAKMREEAGSESSPNFDELLTQMIKLERLLDEQIAPRMEGATANSDSGTSDSSGGQAIGVGSIKSRQDAIRALDAIAAFFRQNEPSSPVPLFIERAKRLVAKDFLEVLADIAPDALAQAKSASGVRDSE